MCCRVATCCFVTDLRLATLIIAVLSLVGNAIVVAFAAGVCNMKIMRLVLWQLLHGEAASGESFLPVPCSFRVSPAVVVVILPISTAAILLDFVLFFGAFRRRSDAVQCWLYGHAVACGAYLIFWLQLLDLFVASFQLNSLLCLGATLVVTALTLYFWMVVRCYDLKLQQTHKSTVSGSCGPTSGYSYDPAPSRLSSPKSNEMPLAGASDKPPPYPPPPYTISH